MPENIREILGSVKKDRWVKKLSKIKTGMDEYEKERLRISSDTIDDIVKEYLNPVLPAYWEVFHTHNISRRRTGALPCRENDHNHLPYYDIGIFLVGFSSLPIALSLAEIQPREEIYFLYSKDTEDTLYEIYNRIETMLCGSNPELVQLVENTVLCNPAGASLKIDSPADPVATFKQIKGIVDWVGSDKTIALDLTGGKKTMIGGGFTAGAILGSTDNIDMFYIDSLEYDEKRGAPQPGTEFLSLLENPYDVYNVQTVQEAKKLFEQHNYEAASNLWEGVEKKLESHAMQYALKAEMENTKRHRRMTNCYYHWDAFYYQRAKGIKNRPNNFGYQEKHVCDLIDVLDILSEVRNRTTLFAKKKRVIHYAVDRYQNAIRRMDSGKLDDAIVRFAQVIEMICIYEIKQIATNGGLFTGEGNPVSNAPNDWGFIPLIRFLFEPTAQYERLDGRYYKISDDHHLLIGSYDCETVEEIINLIKFRHDFIHFNNRMNQDETEENAQGLKQLARKFLKNAVSSYYCDDGLSFDELLDLHKFRW